MAEVCQPKTRTHKILLFILVFFTYGYFFQGGTGSAAPQFALIRSILERGALHVDGYPTGADIIVYGGHLYSNKAPGNALVGFIPFSIFFILLPLLKIPLWIVEHLVIYFTTLFTTTLFSILLCILIYQIMLRVTEDPLSSLMAGFAYGLGTIAFPFATMFFTHQVASFLCFSAFYFLFEWQQRSSAKGNKIMLVLSGFLAGLGVITEYPTFIIAVALTGYAFFILKPKLDILWFILGGLIAAFILMAYNYAAFHNPFLISYQAYIVSEKAAFLEHEFGLLGITYPRLNIFWRITLGPQRGLFYFNPILLLVFPGLIFWWLRKTYRKEFWIILGIIVAFFCFNASYGDSIAFWGGGASTGPRHLIPMIPFAMLLVGVTLHKMKKLFFIFFLPSFFIMLLATSVDPILRYEFARPLSQFLLPSFLRGELAINQYGIFNNQFITKDSVAFNVGQLMGLGGTFSLLPLFGIWLAGLWCLSSKLKSQHLLSRKNQYGLLAGTGLFIMGLVFFPLLYQVHESKFVIAGKGTGLIGYYYAGAKWEGNPVFIRKDAKIYFQWEGKKAPPLPAPFSVEWKGKLIIPRGGIYTFYSESDDGSWIYIDGRVVVDNSGRHAPILKSGNIRLAKGEHQLLIKYVNLEHSAVMKLLWKPPGKIQEVIPTRYLLQR